MNGSRRGKTRENRWPRRIFGGPLEFEQAERKTAARAGAAAPETTGGGMNRTGGKMKRDKIMAALAVAAFFYAMGVVGAVEQGAPLGRLLLVIPALALSYIFARSAVTY